MKTLLIAASLATLGLATACGPTPRTPEQYRDDTKAVLDTKNNDIRACYDGVLQATPAVGGKVTVKFDVEIEGGKLVNIVVDKANTTAPDAVAACVTKSITGLAIAPPDKYLGQGSFVWEFSFPGPGVYSSPAPKS